jgi:hypothetical protein
VPVRDSLPVKQIGVATAMAVHLDGIEAQIWAAAYGSAYALRHIQGEPGRSSSTEAIAIANAAVAHYSAIAQTSTMMAETLPKKRRRLLPWG